ncbi:MAG: BatD family protein [Candidatus Sumerlaeia bacterium]|nr:BatD family protein [Candidatus Sumerlaeia bacterium]
MVTRSFALLWLLLLALLPAARAQELTAELSDPEPTVGGTLQYVITYKGRERLEITYPDIEASKNISVVAGPSRSSTQVIVNGREEFTQRWTFALSAKAVGDFAIGPATGRVGSREVQSNPVAGRVKEVPTVDASGLSGVISARTESREVNEQLEGRYFVFTEHDTGLFEQQAMRVRTFLYRDPSLPAPVSIARDDTLGGADFVELSSNDAWQRNVGLQWQAVQFQGRRMVRALINETYLLATKSGKRFIDGVTYRVGLPTQNNADRQFLFLTPRSITAVMRTVPVEIDVRELPKPPEPVLGTTVGSGRFTATVDRANVAENDVVTLRLRIEGEGYYEALSPPALPGIDGLALVETTASGAARENGGRFYSSREFEYIFRAERDGAVRVPPLAFAFFDPATERHTIARTEPVAITITPSTAASIAIATTARGAAAEAEREGARQLGDDIAFIDRRSVQPGDARLTDRPLYTRPWFLAAHLVLPLGAAGAGLAVHWTRRRRAGADAGRTLAKRWRQEADAAVRKARAGMAKATGEEFYAELRRGAMFMAAALLGRSPQGLTLDEAVAGLREHGVGDDALDAFRTVVSRADSARYAPGSDDPAARQDALGAAERALGLLSKAVRA